MGWTGYPNDRRETVDIVREELVGYSDRYKVVAHSGAKHWVLENTEDNKRYAVVVLCKRRDGMLFTKVMDESMGPCYYDFPERFLNLLSDTDNEYAVEWRQAVREYHASKKATSKLVKGDTVVFSKPIDFTGDFSLDRMTYLGGYRFRGALPGGRGVNVTLPKTWRTSYDWTIESVLAKSA
jgi:hypothetical protein